MKVDKAEKREEQRKRAAIFAREQRQLLRLINHRRWISDQYQHATHPRA